jgi:hypothetical protein
VIPYSVIPSSVSVHYLSNGCTHSTQIWHMDMSWENTDQAQILSWLDDFWQIYAPYTLKVIWNFQFPFIISPTVLHIQLKIPYGYVKGMSRSSLNLVMVQWFLAELCPFHFENNMHFQFPFIISSRVLHIQLIFDIWIYVKEMRRSTSNFVMLWWFLSYAPLTFMPL